jgi:lipoprotein-releasing system permease protein
MQRINKWKSDQVGAFEVFVDDLQYSRKGEEVYQHHQH